MVNNFVNFSARLSDTEPTFFLNLTKARIMLLEIYVVYAAKSIFRHNAFLYTILL